MADAIKQVTTEFLAQRRNLMAFIYWLVRDPHVAEDIFQEVWLKLAGALEAGVAIENQANWCRGAAKNLILHHWRDQRDSKIVADSEFIERVEIAFHDLKPEWSARREALDECVRALPEKSRRLLCLKYESGFSIKAIAQELRQSAESVIKALLRLRHALGQCIERKIKFMNLGL
ncbi:MAG: sigma-70 family RNA polymerase sigma factor [Verrucomicrobiales bacterium]|nr:sigma-70 family RNA polymerase sigma factor [Verrucomicrobiales bacterium]